MSNDIPQSVRDGVRHRARQRCERCHVPTPQGHVHHRRSRSVRGPHCHCRCNLVYLCSTCHADVHSHPFESSKTGWIVSRHILEPSAIPVVSPVGERILDCTGGVTFRYVEATETPT